jgi:hypothetical protein
MKNIASNAPVEDRRPRWLLWRIAVPFLTLLFVVFPAVMPPPPHAGTMAVAAPAETVPMEARTTGSCPPMDMCGIATVEQALPRLPVPPALLFAFIVIAFAVRWPHRPLAMRHVWWWPPDRRRALLQVFLM